MNPNMIYQLLGGAQTLDRPLRSYGDLIHLSERGIPKSGVNRLVRTICGAEDVATNIEDSVRLRPLDEVVVRNLIVPDATYRRNELFRQATAERVIRYADLFSKAKAVIGIEESAREFLASPHLELGDRSPLQAARNAIGARAVEDILERAAHGFPV